MLIVFGIVMTLALVALVAWAKRQREDVALDLALKTTYRQAQIVLSPEDISRLRQHLAALDQETIEAQGRIGNKPAIRLGKLAAIRTIHAFMDIDNTFKNGL